MPQILQPVSSAYIQRSTRHSWLWENDVLVLDSVLWSYGSWSSWYYKRLQKDESESQEQLWFLVQIIAPLWPFWDG